MSQAGDISKIRNSGEIAMSSVLNMLTFLGAAKACGSWGVQVGPLSPLTNKRAGMLVGFHFILFFNRVLIAPARQWLQMLALLPPGLPLPAALAIRVQDMKEFSRNWLLVMAYKLTWGTQPNPRDTDSTLEWL